MYLDNIFHYSWEHTVHEMVLFIVIFIICICWIIHKKAKYNSLFNSVYGLKSFDWRMTDFFYHILAVLAYLHCIKARQSL